MSHASTSGFIQTALGSFPERSDSFRRSDGRIDSQAHGRTPRKAFLRAGSRRFPAPRNGDPDSIVISTGIAIRFRFISATKKQLMLQGVSE
jgi:hypothetical protein